jgi:threonylcarbamoyladenosine tRNA methylthiotransferase MtaB
MGHIFPFSPKRGTPAARMPLVAPAVVKERARRLREACARRKAAWLQALVGTRQRVLVEKDGRGRAENFAPVRVRRPREGGDPSETSHWSPGPRLGDGEVVESLITAVDGDSLIGIPA